MTAMPDGHSPDLMETTMSKANSIERTREPTETELLKVAGGVHEAKAGSWLTTNKSVVNIPPTK